MAKRVHKVEFDAHKKLKRPTTVKFTTKTGEKVRFKAKKQAKVPVHVSFRAKSN